MQTLMKIKYKCCVNIRQGGLHNKEQHRQGETLCNDKRVKPPRKHSNPKCMCTKQESCKIHNAITDRTERRKEQINNCC